MPDRKLPAVVQDSLPHRCSPTPNQSNGRICSGWPLYPSEAAARFLSVEKENYKGEAMACRCFAYKYCEEMMLS